KTEADDETEGAVSVHREFGAEPDGGGLPAEHGGRAVRRDERRYCTEGTESACCGGDARNWHRHCGAAFQGCCGVFGVARAIRCDRVFERTREMPGVSRHGEIHSLGFGR